MAYFPIFTDLKDKEVLIAGGGRIALRKAEKLLPFGARITVVSPKICNELQALPGLNFVYTAFTEEMLKTAFMVIAATDDKTENHRISELCKERGIPVNSVDCPRDCSFIFPSLIKRGPLTIGISTGGSSPAGAKYLRESLEKMLPEGIEDILDSVSKRRSEIKACENLFSENEELRTKLCSRLFTESIEKGAPLTDEEFKVLKEGLLTDYQVKNKMNR